MLFWNSHRLDYCFASTLLVVSFALAGCATPTTSQLPAGSGAARKSESIDRGVAASDARLGEGFFVSSDGARFPCTRWLPAKSPPKTLVVAVHGLSGAASDFRPLGEYFAKRSTAIYSYALRGQGNDPRRERVGDIRSPQLWFADLDTFLQLVRDAHPEARVFLYGESLGGTLSEGNRNAIRGLILASPVVSLKDRRSVPRLRYKLLQTAIRILPRRRISLERLAGDKQDMRITGDTDHRENLRNTPHAVDEYSFRLLGTLEKLIDGSLEKASEISKPILVLYPAHDLLTTPEDVESWYASLKTEDKEKYLFKESYHMLLHDEESAVVLKRVRSWLDRH